MGKCHGTEVSKAMANCSVDCLVQTSKGIPKPFWSGTATRFSPFENTRNVWNSSWNTVEWIWHVSPWWFEGSMHSGANQKANDGMLNLDGLAHSPPWQAVYRWSSSPTDCWQYKGSWGLSQAVTVDGVISAEVCQTSCQDHFAWQRFFVRNFCRRIWWPSNQA